MRQETRQVRNIGISAHIDAGKTTLSERILFYTGRIHRMGEVRGGGATAGATLDHRELEREKGITISAAASWCEWGGCWINLIDTPGHVDFTVEVERSLRVLDGAILVLCAVAGVQPQTWTVDRQMRRHGLPRLAFVNKCDRAGADAARAVAGLRERLGLNAALVQLPVYGAGEAGAGGLIGVIDLLERRMLRFLGERGERVEAGPIPEGCAAEAGAARAALVERVAEADDALMARWLELDGAGEIPPAELRAAIRRATVAGRFVPALCGSAYQDTGVQPLLDAVVDWLPSPSERSVAGRDAAGEPVRLDPDPAAPALALAFKQEEGDHGALCWLRLYRGRLRAGATLVNLRTGRRIRLSRLLRIHAAQTVEVAEAEAGDIVAAPGLDCASGDTLADPAGDPVRLEGIAVPEPVVASAVHARSREDLARVSAALARACREDPSLRLTQDPETGLPVLHGMGELHLDVCVEEIRRRLRVPISLGAPEVAWREAITRRHSFAFTLSKQTGGPGMYARLVGWIEPAGDLSSLSGDLSGVGGGLQFESRISGGAVPEPFVMAAAAGFTEALQRGPLRGAPVLGARVVLTDGLTHPVDSSERAFRTAAAAIVREALPQAGPILLEPLLAASVDLPDRYLGAVLGWLAQRRFEVAATEAEAGAEPGGAGARIRGLLPASQSFGLVNGLRSLTQGYGACSLEFGRYGEARHA